MKPFVFSIALALALTTHAQEDIVILDATGVKNLRIETITAEERDFEETAFALGRIETVPGSSGVVSSRISGRIAEVLVAPGDTVVKGQVVAKVESRQPGDPPPVIDLKSPIDGLVMAVAARSGEPVEPDRILVEIADLTEVDAVASLPEDLAGRLEAGAESHIRVAALPGEVFKGTLIRFGTTVDRGTGTLAGIFRLKNESGRLRPGMRAEYAVVLGKRENVTSVPRAALQGEPSRRFVFVKHFDLPNAFIRTPVEVGSVNAHEAEILSGLFPADEVVTRGAYSLSFAGGASGISLKEALDAAHGHEHAEDGSELTPEKKAEMEAAKKGGSHDHDHDHEEGGSPMWKYVSAALFVLFLAALFGRRKAHPAAGETEAADEAPAAQPQIEDR
ncbi:MAG TPA: efflux RND transporter periplasmic adaptor subunit [Bacteroidia bacterium]|nr:efflux RND transporter periplasmic adaptor subunit [Bacteroidia bacterium]